MCDTKFKIYFGEVKQECIFELDDNQVWEYNGLGIASLNGKYISLDEESISLGDKPQQFYLYK